MKRTIIAVIVMSLLLAILPVCLALAATSDEVIVTATPSFISISNLPSTYDFTTVSANSTDNTTDGYFTITNGSSEIIDIFIKCNGWSGTSSWTYGSPAADTGQLRVSSADGGSDGSSGAGNFDKTLLDGTDTLICDNVTDVTDPTWELLLDAPTSFSHGYQQTTNVTVTATSG